jgi:arsenate reductase-like glutaredoxin family protein
VIQVFGRRDSRPTQKALRFFKERRVEISYVDLATRPLAPAELRRFAHRLGADELLDREGPRFAELGLGYMRLDSTELAERLLADQALLRLPLIRNGEQVTAGLEEPTWKAWLRGGG